MFNVELGRLRLASCGVVKKFKVIIFVFLLSINGNEKGIIGYKTPPYSTSAMLACGQMTYYWDTEGSPAYNG